MRPTEWHPSRDHGAAPPRVSVLLPTFRRGASGLLMKSALSVLQQTWSDLELIIVDDGSTDGTAGQVEELMGRDPRVSCLRHPRNVGLPAVSEYEAFLKARGDYLAFAFDDDEFHPDAIERLMAIAGDGDHAMVHGYVEVQGFDEASGEPLTYSLGLGDVPVTTLQAANYIANTSVILHRRVVERVGFFDPHVAIVRLCDWDLWRRVAGRFRIVAAEVPVGVVGGPATTDSLEQMHALDLWLSHEWCNRDRDHRLLPREIEDYDVLATPAGFSREGRLALEEIRKGFSDRWWFPAKTVSVSGRSGRRVAGDALPEGRLMVVTGFHDASTVLCFDHLPEAWRSRVRVAHPRHAHPQEMIGASAVVFVRHLTDVTGLVPWIDLAAMLRIPRYYFLDDNFLVLASEPGHRAEAGDYTAEWLRERLRSFSGVLLSTPRLLEFFEAESVHDNLLLFPPIGRRPDIEDSEPFPAKRAGVFRVAFFGGPHRTGPFAELVAPALARVAEGRDVDLVAAGDGEDWRDSGSIARVLTAPFEVSYDLALSRFAKAGIDVLCHPNSKTANNPYKTLNALINAWAMGAVPLVSDGPPFESVRDEGVAILCGDTSDDWLEALQRVAGSAALRDGIRKRLDRFCRERFDGRVNAEALRRILEQHPPAGLTLRDARARSAMELLRVPPPPPPVPEPQPEAREPALTREPIKRASARTTPSEDRVVLRIPVGAERWCGVDVDMGPEPTECEGGEFALRLLSDDEGELRETASSPALRAAGWLPFRFGPVLNSAGRAFLLEITPQLTLGGSSPQGADVSEGAPSPVLVWHFLRSTPRIAYRLYYAR